MLCARSLLLISVASIAVSTGRGMAQSLFPLPFPLPGSVSLPFPSMPSPFPSAPSPSPETSTYLPPDADPNYSTPGGFDKDVNMSLATRKVVIDPTGEQAGTVTINTRERKLYLSMGDGRALQYGIGVGRQGFAWKGVAEVGRKAFWPGWTPPPEMLARQPELPDHLDGGMENPLGARALYLFQGNKDTLFRIHGTNEPKSIGKAVSSGCIRMLDSDVIDLYQRVAKGTRVVVL
jgi:lipoprotein-anchoring transpeptidase ErfK/SrfK